VWKDKGRGKGTVSPFDTKNDPLLFISQYFLDGMTLLKTACPRLFADRLVELEYAALRNTTEPEIQACDLCMQHLKDSNLATMPNSGFVHATNWLITHLAEQYRNTSGYTSSLKDLHGDILANRIYTVRRLELELLQSGKVGIARTFDREHALTTNYSQMQLPPDVYFDVYVKQVRESVDSLQTQFSLQYPPRSQYHKLGIELMASFMQAAKITTPLSLHMDESRRAVPSFDPVELSMPMTTDLNLDDFLTSQTSLAFEPLAGAEIDDFTHRDQQVWPSSPHGPATFTVVPVNPGMPLAPPSSTGETPKDKANADMCCEFCGYRPKGDPKWFHGSMAKHKKNQHAEKPPNIYQCPFPECKSRYKNRPDNLRQHQIEKGHFVDGQDKPVKARKRRKLA
jgi:hypothetical protein